MTVGSVSWYGRREWRRVIRYSCLLALFFSLAASAQTKKDSVTHFKVKYITGDYTFVPADEYLFIDGNNRLRIRNSRNVPFEVKATNGTVTKVNDSTFTIGGLANAGSTLVSVFESDATGEKKIVVNKPFSVVPSPKVKYSGIACDSAMSALMLATGSMSVYYKSINKKVPVTTFKMEFFDQQSKKFTLDSSFNNRLSKKMLKYVEKLKPGSLVYMSDIKYKDPGGNEHTDAMFRVFIIPESKMLKFGLNN